MADSEDTTQNQPGSEADGTPREAETGRYLSRHDGKDGDPDQKDDKKDDEEKEGKKRWLLLLILLLILLLLLCAGFAYMQWWRKDEPKDPVATPSVVATTQAAKPSPSATSPSPSASPSPKTVAMPNVVGKPAPEAKTILEAAGLTNIKFVEEGKTDSLTLLVSFVVTQQSVAPGTQVLVDAPVVISCKTSSNGKG